MDFKIRIVRTPRLLQAVAGIFMRENGIDGGLASMLEMEPEVKKLLISHGIITASLKLLDRPFGYTCYEYYRQLCTPNEFDQLLLQAARNRRVILDLCCGAGATIHALLPLQPQIIYGFDYNADQIHLLRSLIAEIDDYRGTRVVTEIADAHQTGLEDASVDLVVCRVSLHYLNEKRALKEAARVLRPNGAVFLLVHGSGYLYDYVISRRGLLSGSLWKSMVVHSARYNQEQRRGQRFGAHFITQRFLRRALVTSGFRNIRMVTSGKWMRLGILPVYYAAIAERGEG
ncbi:class I SAM-dependent methyltransferase [Paenibacillus sp. H1-7]|uniref:class I SAM-dependent methyltransferase n=1 Tax=Paenibacillus sp. H1-7 TaxID=2282849 RepID=UPI001EF901B2|nr:class I SAM-dependent methyltransferase [Paenibacillus sp. H1-7]ULL17511.1 class I SAM-dependent methyltransferase [Paenibacillus sp. H1-7]